MTNNHPENHPGNNPGPPEDDPFFKAALEEYNPAYWNTARHHDRDIEESMMLAPVGNEEDMFDEMDAEEDSGMGAMQRGGIRKNTMASDDEDEDDNSDQDDFEAEEELYEDLDEDFLNEDEDLDEDLYEDDDMEEDETGEDY